MAGGWKVIKKISSKGGIMIPAPTQTMSWMHPVKFLQNWLFGQSGKKPATIKALIIEETIKTIRVEYKHRTAWLQKSLIMLEQNEGNRVTIVIPHWLFTRKFNGLKLLNRKR